MLRNHYIIELSLSIVMKTNVNSNVNISILRHIFVCIYIYIYIYILYITAVCTVKNKRLNQGNKMVECSIYLFNLCKRLSQQYTLHSTF